MKSIKEKINEAIVKHNIKNAKNDKDMENINKFLHDVPKFSLLKEQKSKDDVTKEILNKATYIIYNSESLSKFIELRKDDTSYNYIICWWKDLGPNTYVHYCHNYNEKGTIEWQKDEEFVIKYKALHNNNILLPAFVISEDTMEDYNDNIYELVIIETKN